MPAATAACPTASLNGGEWILEDLGGKPPMGSVQAGLTFLEAGKVAGNGSCNRFAGSAEISGRAIRFGALAATRMMCEPDASKQETEYLKALEGVRRFEVQGESSTSFPKEAKSRWCSAARVEVQRPFRARNSLTTAATSR